jgi:hypothetical protein
MTLYERKFALVFGFILCLFNDDPSVAGIISCQEDTLGEWRCSSTHSYPRH